MLDAPAVQVDRVFVQDSAVEDRVRNSADCSGSFPAVPHIVRCPAAVVAVVVDIDKACAVQVAASLESRPIPIFPAACEGSAVAPAHQDYSSLTYIFTLLWMMNIHDDANRNNIRFQPLCIRSVACLIFMPTYTDV